MGTWTFWHCYCFLVQITHLIVHFQCIFINVLLIHLSARETVRTAGIKSITTAKSRMIGKLTKSSFMAIDLMAQMFSHGHHFLVNLIRGCSGQKDKRKNLPRKPGVTEWSQLCFYWQPWRSARHQQPVGAPGPRPVIPPPSRPLLWLRGRLWLRSPCCPPGQMSHRVDTAGHFSLHPHMWKCHLSRTKQIAKNQELLGTMLFISITPLYSGFQSTYRIINPGSCKLISSTKHPMYFYTILEKGSLACPSTWLKVGGSPFYKGANSTGDNSKNFFKALNQMEPRSASLSSTLHCFILVNTEHASILYESPSRI